MAGKEFNAEVLRYNEAEVHSGGSRYSEVGELNNGFNAKLKQHRRKYGGGGCTRSNEHPIEGDAEVFLTGYEGDSIEQTTVYTADATLAEGDAATILTGEKKYRVKFFGLSIERPDQPNIKKTQSAYVSFDVWDAKEELWVEVEPIQGFNESLERTFPEGETVRITVNTARGRDAEADFKWLMSRGLSPAEAIDYWMVEIMNEKQSQWAEKRSKTRQAVSKNIQSAKSKL